MLARAGIGQSVAQTAASTPSEVTSYPTAAATATALAEEGPAKVQEFNEHLFNTQGDHTPIFNYVNQSIEYWQNIQLQDQGNGDTPGTLGYFAVSARDFWSEIGDAYDNGANPNVIINQLNIWRAYTLAIAGQPIPGAQPIDLWHQANG